MKRRITDRSVQRRLRRYREHFMRASHSDERSTTGNEPGRGLAIESTCAAYVQNVLRRLWAPQFKRISEADGMSHHLSRDLTQPSRLAADFSARDHPIA